jgi:hypothetical protein
MGSSIDSPEYTIQGVANIRKCTLKGQCHETNGNSKGMGSLNSAFENADSQLSTSYEK